MAEGLQIHLTTVCGKVDQSARCTIYVEAEGPPQVQRIAVRHRGTQTRENPCQGRSTLSTTLLKLTIRFSALQSEFD